MNLVGFCVWLSKFKIGKKMVLFNSNPLVFLYRTFQNFSISDTLFKKRISFDSQTKHIQNEYKKYF